MTQPIHRGEIYSGPDKWGYYHFALFWMADYHPGHPDGEHRLAERGQHYYAEAPQYPNVTWKDLRSRTPRPHRPAWAS